MGQLCENLKSYLQVRRQFYWSNKFRDREESLIIMLMMMMIMTVIIKVTCKIFTFASIHFHKFDQIFRLYSLWQRAFISAIHLVYLRNILMESWYCMDRVSSCNIYAVQQDTQSVLMSEFYSALILARHVSDLIGPSSGVFCTSCIRRFGMWYCCAYYSTRPAVTRVTAGRVE